MAALVEEGTAGPVAVSHLSSEESFTSQYTVLKTIGRGSYASVKLAHHHLTGTPVAVKVLLKGQQTPLPIGSEVEIMRMVDHPNVAALIQVIETQQRVYLIMELADGESLLQSISEFGYLLEEEARKIFRQVLKATGYCHTLGVVHRDLKPDNIMTDFMGRVKLIDFGMAAKFQPGQMLAGLCGTYEFSAPELFLHQACDPARADTWSLGVLLYFMVTGTLPFKAARPQVLVQQIVRGKYSTPHHLSRGLQSVIRRLLTSNPKRRPTAKEIMGHPWLRQGCASGRDDIIPSCPDCDIITAMAGIGFNPQDVLDSLLHRKCNESMAVYHMFRMQASNSEDLIVQTKPVCPGLTPCSSPTDPTTFPQTLRRSVSIPNLHHQRTSSSKGQLPKDHQWAVERMEGRRVTMATIPLSCWQRMATRGTATLSPLTAPLTFTSHSSGGDPRKTMLSHSPTEEHRLYVEAAPEWPPTCPWDRPRGWRQWSRRIRNGFLKLCCTPPKDTFEKTDSPFPKQTFPVQGGDKC